MTINYRVQGHGDLRLIVLHGWLSDSQIFDGITPFFDERKYTLAFVDYRGYGMSRGISGKYTIDEIAADTLAVADELGWRQFHVLSHSMGGMVIQKMAVMAPSKVLSGAAITPVPASGFDMDEGTLSFFQSSATDDTALTEIFNILTGKRHPTTFLTGLVAKTRAATNHDAYLGYLAAWTKTDFSAEVGEIKAPILVIAGAHDGALGPDHMNSTYMSQLTNVSMDVLDGAGHYPMLETPPELFGRIDAFFTPLK